MKHVFYLSFVLLILPTFNGCKKDEMATLAVLSTAPVTNITTNSAKCGGNITSDGNLIVLAYGVCWNTTINPQVTDSSTIDGMGTGQFVSDIGNLAAGRTYHIRAYATSSAGTAYGNDISFRTLGRKPEVKSLHASNITISSATLDGTINANNLSTVVTFEYGLSQYYGKTITAIQSPVAGSTNSNVSADISGLALGTNYFFRLRAKNSLGTVYSENRLFITLGQTPTSGRN